MFPSLKALALPPPAEFLCAAIYIGGKHRDTPSFFQIWWNAGDMLQEMDNTFCRKSESATVSSETMIELTIFDPQRFRNILVDVVVRFLDLDLFTEMLVRLRAILCRFFMRKRY